MGSFPHLRVHAINVYVRDQEQSLRFYTDQLGFRSGLRCAASDRLVESLRRHRHLPAQGIISAVVEEVRRFSAYEQHDDITLTVAKCR